MKRLAIALMCAASAASADPVRVGRYAEIPYGVRRDHYYATEQGDARRTGRLRGRAPTSAPSMIWEHELGHRRPRGPIVAADGTLYISTMAGLLALDAEGRMLWAAPVGGIHAAPSFLPSGDIVSATRSGVVVVVSPDGAVRRSIDLAAPIRGSPLVLDDGSIVVATLDQQVRRLDSSLRPIFTTPVGDGSATSLSLTSRGEIAVAAGAQLALLSMGGAVLRVVALGGRATSSPAIGDDGSIWVTLAEGQLVHFDPSAAILGRVELGSRHYDDAAIAIGPDGAVRVPTVMGGVACIDAVGERWRASAGGPGFSGPASIDADGTVLLVDRGGRLVAIGADGAERWAVAVGTYAYSAPAMGAGGTIYVVTERGTLQAWR